MMTDNGLGGVAVGGEIIVAGDEARHAIRVKRVRVGERVEVLDGRGVVARGVVSAVDEGGKKRDGSVTVQAERVEAIGPNRPRVEVWTAVPKGGRVDEMVDQLAQIGAAEWRPLLSARGVAGAREQKVERLERIAREASKQCGRAWTMEIGGTATLEEAMRGGGTAPLVVVCDASGEPWLDIAQAASGSTSRSEAVVRLLVGPEGGWTAEELATCRAAGARVATFGSHVMRIETAAVVACGVVMAGA